jgi:hypothetical protein
VFRELTRIAETVLLVRGAHFAACGQPDTFVTEVRAAFRPLRQD